MRVLRFLMEASKPYKLYLYVIAFVMTFVSIDANVKPYLVKLIIDLVSANDYTNIWLIIFAYIMMQAGLVLSWSIYDLCVSKFYPNMIGYITQILLEKLNAYPYRFFQEQLSGSLSSKLSDVATLSPQIVIAIVNEFLHLFLLLLISIFVLSTVHYGFGIAITVWILIFMPICYSQMKRASFLSNVSAQADAHIWGNVVDRITNMFSIKIFASHKYEKQRLEIKLNDFISKDRRKVLYLRSYFTIQGTLFSLYIISCLLFMVYLSKRNLITPGDFAIIFLLNFEIINHLFQATTVIKSFITNIGTVDQALVTLEEVPDILDKPNASKLKVTKGEIVFDSVKFNYSGAEPLFQNKSIVIPGGQKIGLVGYSGGGKSTFVNLILRLYDVNAGHILIDGQDIACVTQDSLRSQIVMIPQDPTLFHRTILENIRYGRMKARHSEVIKAAKKAHAHEFISKLPSGYEALVGERGIKLSGGQRQRIAIARAILKNAPILILDEATSQLDSVTEDYIQESLLDLMRDKTAIIIAHRLSTLLRMDRIIVFDRGKIVEDGTHKQLLRNKGLYRTLWDAQVGGFLQDKRNGAQ